MYGLEGEGGNGLFSGLSFYEKLLVRKEVAFQQRLVWIPKVLRKMCLFNSLLRRGVIILIEYQRTRKVTHISWSFMCSGENDDRLILYHRVGLRSWCETLFVWNMLSYASHGERFDV